MNPGIHHETDGAPHLIGELAELRVRILVEAEIFAELKAILHGRIGIAYPVSDGPYINSYFQDIMALPSAPGEPSYGLLPFPPLPAVMLMPFVAVFGLATDAQLFGAVLGAIYLVNTFDQIYILDLHGDRTKKERAPGGGPDANVFTT